jgi:hypothetical protein
MYLRFAGQVFRPRWQRWLLANRYRTEPLEQLLRASLQPPGTPAEAQAFRNFDSPADMPRLQALADAAAAREVFPPNLAFPSG